MEEGNRWRTMVLIPGSELINDVQHLEWVVDAFSLSLLLFENVLSDLFDRMLFTRRKKRARSRFISWWWWWWLIGKAMPPDQCWSSDHHTLSVTRGKWRREDIIDFLRCRRSDLKQHFSERSMILLSGAFLRVSSPDSFHRIIPSLPVFLGNTQNESVELVPRDNQCVTLTLSLLIEMRRQLFVFDIIDKSSDNSTRAKRREWEDQHPIQHSIVVSTTMSRALQPSQPVQ